MASSTPRRSPAKRGPRAAPPAAPPEFPVAQVMEHLSAVALLMGSFHLRHILTLYAAFDRDLLEAVVLGEVALHNFSAIRTAAGDPREPSALARRRDEKL